MSVWHQVKQKKCFWIFKIKKVKKKKIGKKVNPLFNPLNYTKECKVITKYEELAENIFLENIPPTQVSGRAAANACQQRAIAFYILKTTICIL